MAKGDTVKDTRSEDEEEEGEEEEESRSEGVARNETLGCNGKEARIVYAKQADKKISWIILLTTKKKRRKKKEKKNQQKEDAFGSNLPREDLLKTLAEK